MIQPLSPFFSSKHQHLDDAHTAHPPLFDASTIRQIETLALTHVLPHETSLMQRAGYATARLAQACYPHASNILIIAGKGNNGADAIAAATYLKKMGKNVHLLWLGSPEQASQDTLKAFQIAQAAQLSLHPYSQETTAHIGAQSFDLIIDGLLGIGLNASKSLSDESIHLITVINRLKAPCIAIDAPSGLITATGSTHTHAVRAQHTLTFLAAKPGLFTAQGREYCGHIWLDTLGIKPYTSTPSAYLYSPTSNITPRAHNAHKGTFGDVAIIGGASGMTGAAILAARAAMKAGAGRTYLSLLDNEHRNIPAQLDINAPEIMFRPINQLSFKQSIIACGCGGGTQVKAWLPQLLHECPRLVLDADALNAIATDKELQQQLQTRKTRNLATIITPHPLEAARLLQTSPEEIQNDRLNAAQKLANLFNCTCVLKGSGTITATPAQTPYINSSGNAALATAGSGDVLCGWLAGCWSATHKQQENQPHHLAAQCVWEHGHAADRWVKTGHYGALPASTLTQWI